MFRWLTYGRGIPDVDLHDVRAEASSRVRHGEMDDDLRAIKMDARVAQIKFRVAKPESERKQWHNAVSLVPAVSDIECCCPRAETYLVINSGELGG